MRIMERLMELQKSLILFFEGAGNPFLDTLFEGITMLGEQYLYFALISWIYWNVSRQKGFLLTMGFLAASFTNGLLKLAFRTPRPFEVLDAVQGKRVHTATGYSFPSGHSQGAAGFFSSLAFLIRKTWFTTLAALIILLVALSRLYLGVHWPMDVLFGVLFGLASSLPVLIFFHRIMEDRERFLKSLSRLILALSLFSLIALVVDVSGITGNLKSSDFFKVLGSAVGGIGGFFLAETGNSVSTAGGPGKKTLRWLLGMIGAMVVLTGLKVLFPDANPFHFLRYLAATLWITFLYPRAGRKAGLFS